MARIKKWRGKEVTQEVAQNVAQALGEIALRAEGYAKKELRKGHGVVTGTLRRSIHVVQPGYAWNSDNVVPSTGSPERGGKQVEAVRSGSTLTVQVGSGLVYALAIHQGWEKGYKQTKGTFAGYHFITNGVEKAKKDVNKVLKKYKL